MYPTPRQGASLPSSYSGNTEEFVHSYTLCAWCLAEKNIRPAEKDSHGICELHAQAMLQEYRARRKQARA